MPFDELLAAIDRLVEIGEVTEKVICQIGHSTYEPRNCEWFRFRPSIDDLMDEADIVVTHGGSTVFLLLQNGKRFVAMPNPRGADDHQGQLLSYLAKRCDLIWSRRVEDLGELLVKVRTAEIRPFAEPKLGDNILTFLKNR